MSDQAPPPSSLPGSVIQSLLTGQLDHGLLPRLPHVGGRPFWLGAAIGAGLVLMLRARPQAAAGGDHPPPAAL